MIRISRQQIDAYRQAQINSFAADTESFLRRYFANRLRACSSEDIHDAVLLARVTAGEYDINRRGEMLTYLACACVCGLFLFEDPRCVWMFHERPALDRMDIVMNFNVRTFARNLETCLGYGFFREDSMDDYQDAVLTAERLLLQAGGEIKQALLSMTPAREWFVETHFFSRFLDVARTVGRQRDLVGHELDRYVFLGWLFGVRFIDDPLCRPVMAFLHEAR